MVGLLGVIHPSTHLLLLTDCLPHHHSDPPLHPVSTGQGWGGGRKRRRGRERTHQAGQQWGEAKKVRLFSSHIIGSFFLTDNQNVFFSLHQMSPQQKSYCKPTECKCHWTLVLSGFLLIKSMLQVLTLYPPQAPLPSGTEFLR